MILRLILTQCMTYCFSKGGGGDGGGSDSFVQHKFAQNELTDSTESQLEILLHCV